MVAGQGSVRTLVSTLITIQGPPAVQSHWNKRYGRNEKAQHGGHTIAPAHVALAHITPAHVALANVSDSSDEPFPFQDLLLQKVHTGQTYTWELDATVTAFRGSASLLDVKNSQLAAGSLDNACVVRLGVVAVSMRSLR